MQAAIRALPRGERSAASGAGAQHEHDRQADETPSCWSPPTLRALAFAQALAPASLRAVKVAAEGGDDPLPREWEQRGVPTPLVMIESPYRETVRPVLRYVRHLRREHPGDVVSIIIPEYVVGHWWQNVLHNQTALRLKRRLRVEPSVTVTSVPWVLGSRAVARPAIVPAPSAEDVHE